MLTCKIGNRKFNSFDKNKDEFKKLSKKGILKCPITNEQIIYKHGKIKIPHFAYKEKPEGDYGYWENETKEHYLGKVYLYKWIKKQKSIENLELEKWMPDTKQIADIYFEQFGKKFVIEFQCSNITLEKYLERSFLYSTMDIVDIWIFGTINFPTNISGRRFGGTFENKMKFKLKALEDDQLNENKKLYHFNPFKKLLIKSFYENDVPIIKTQTLDKDIFFNGEGFMYHEEINGNWRKLINSFMKSYSEKNKKELEFRNWIQEFFEIDCMEELLKIDIYKEGLNYYNFYIECVKEKLKGTNIYLTNLSNFTYFPKNLYESIRIEKNEYLHGSRIEENTIVFLKQLYINKKEKIIIKVPYFFFDFKATKPNPIKRRHLTELNKILSSCNIFTNDCEVINEWE